MWSPVIVTLLSIVKHCCSGCPNGFGSTLVGLHSRFRGKPLEFYVVCPQNGTAVLKGLSQAKEPRPVNQKYFPHRAKKSYRYRSTRLHAHTHTDTHPPAMPRPPRPPPRRLLVVCGQQHELRPSKRPCPSTRAGSSAGGSVAAAAAAATTAASTPGLDYHRAREKTQKPRTARAEVRNRPRWWGDYVRGSHRCVLSLRPAGALRGATPGKPLGGASRPPRITPQQLNVSSFG